MRFSTAIVVMGVGTAFGLVLAQLIVTALHAWL
jgi:hypothetical protein